MRLHDRRARDLRRLGPRGHWQFHWLRALRDERAAALQPVDPDLARVAWRELGALVDKLAAGEPYRLTARRAAAGAPAAAPGVLAEFFGRRPNRYVAAPDRARPQIASVVMVTTGVLDLTDARGR